MTPSPSSRWSLPLRIAFRFAFIYFPFFLGIMLTHLGGASSDTAAVWHWLGVDVVVSAAGALVWSVVDRRRLSYPTLYPVLDGFLRLVVVSGMVFYGLSKVFATQFSPLTPPQLNTPLGKAAPIELLWAFMGYSAPYAIFGGVLETGGALLLAFRRTRTLGALVVFGAMANVVALNFSYDVCVKVISTHLLLMDLLLLAPDLERLGNFFFSAPAAPAPARSAVWLSRIAKGVLALVVVSMGVGAAPRSWKRWHAQPSLPPTSFYAVESFTRDGQPLAVPDEERWTYVDIEKDQFVFARPSGVHEFFPSVQCPADEHSGTLEVTPDDPKAPKVQLAYSVPQKERAVLEGTWEGHPFRAELRVLPLESFPLMTHGFHWVKAGFD